MFNFYYEDNMKRKNVPLEDGLHAKLKKISDSKGMKFQYFIQNILQDYLKGVSNGKS